MMFVQRPSPFWLRLIRGSLHPLSIIVLPALLYTFLSVKLPESTALAISATIPIFFISYGFITRHRLDALSLLVLPTIVLKLIVGLIFHGVKAQLLIEPAIMGGLGLVLIGSLLIGKPVLLLFISRLEEATLPVESTALSYHAILRKLAQKFSGDQHHFLSFLTGLSGATLFLSALSHVVLVTLMPLKRVASLLLLLPLVSYGIYITAALVMMGYYMLYRQHLR